MISKGFINNKCSRKLSLWKIVLCFIVLMVFTGPFLMLVGPAQLREYAYKQLVYQVIAKKVTENERKLSQTEQAERLLFFVQTHLYEPAGEIAPDKHSLDNLIRGHGSCDQQSNALIHLAGKLDIKGRLIFLGGAPHSVCDFFLEGDYRIMDPYYGIVFINEQGKIATFDDIQNRFDKLSSDQLDSLVKQELISREDYYRYFSKPYSVFHTNFDRGKLREAINAILDGYYFIAGEVFAGLFQETFFIIDRTDPYLQARQRHLLFRLDRAIEDYKKLLSNPGIQLRDRERIMFFLGQALWDQKNYSACIDWYEKFNKEFPDSRFLSGVQTYLGDSYVKEQKFSNAMDIFVKNQNIQTPIPAMRKRLEESLSQSGEK